jgi:CHAT domain-containing protein/tetratricopeptide (TPR) repeat protein
MNLPPPLGRTGRRRHGWIFVCVLAALAIGAKATQPVLGPALAPGLTSEREIRSGEVHAYPVELQEDQFLRVAVQEQGADIEVRLTLDGSLVTGADSYSLPPPDSVEDLACIAKRSGAYRLEVRSSTAGRYRLAVQALRPAEGEEDRLWNEAVWTHWRALQEQRITDLQGAADLWERLGERRKAAEVLFLLGQHQEKSDERAVAAFERSATLWGELQGSKARKWWASSRNWAGMHLKELGRRDEAESHFRDALAIAREISDDSLQASVLSNLGLLETERGELRKGIENQSESLRFAEKAADRKAEISTLNNLAYAYESAGEKQNALQTYKKGLELALGLENKPLIATLHNNLGDTYGSLGDWERALDHYGKALTLNRKLRERDKEAKTLIGLGAAYQRLGQFEKARQTYRQAFVIAKESDDRESRTAALNNEAFLLLKQGQAGAALEPARTALALAKDFPERELNALYALGTALRETGELAASQEHLEQALALARKTGNQAGEAEVGLALARTELLRGNRREAVEGFRKSIDIVESLRTRIFDQGLRASFLATKQDFYQAYIDSLMSAPAEERAAAVAEAFQSAERARARSLLDILNEARADLLQGLDPALLRKEQQLRDELNARDSARFKLLAQGKPEPRKLAEAERRVEEALEAYSSFQAELRAGSPAYAALTQPQPLSVAEIQEQVLDGRAVLLEYFLGARRSFLWVITPDGIRSFELPARRQIEDMARGYYEQLTARNKVIPNEGMARLARIDRADAEAERLSRQLSRMILAPAERLLKDRRSVLVVADGALQYIPFAALPLPSTGAPLVSRHEVVSLPSASTLAVLRREVREREPAPKTLAVFADPVFEKTDARLTGSARVERPRLAFSPRQGSEDENTSFKRLASTLTEAQKISGLVPPDQRFLATGFAASRAAVLSPEIGRYRNVHFATHGVLDSRRPELSKLVFSRYDAKGRELKEHFLRLNDVYNLRLDADLVVLSACGTALGKEIRGEGLVGLTRGFMYAGSARVLASLWSVEDRATAELMGAFYRGMLRERLSPAAALRKAQLEMARSVSYKSPYYWAGFSLQGEWK